MPEAHFASQPLIRIEELYHKFSDGTEAISGISLDVNKGSFTVIGGENGSGKTMLMKHLNGILTPTAGRVIVNGIDVKKDSWSARKTIGFVFQNPDTQFVAQTVRDDIAFGPANLGYNDKDVDNLVSESAETLGISELLDHSPHRLSGGEKKKAAIAGIIAMKPEVIVFDEPFAGLDYRGVKTLLKIMLNLHSSGSTIIVITHDLEKVLAHADRLVIMKDGKIKAEGLPADIIKSAAENGLRIPADGDVNRMSWLL